MNNLKHILTSDLSLAVHMAVIAFGTWMLNYLLNHGINRAIKRNIKKEEFDPTNLKFLQRGLNLIIYLVGFAFIIFLIPSLQHIATTLLAGAGVIVAVIGFASQQVLSNIISGIMIILTKPYRLKHRVSVKGMDGVVEDITLRHTVIRNYENKRIIVPNSVMNTEVIINSNFEEDICCEWVEIGISYTADLKKAKDIMQEEILKHPLFIDHRTEDEKAAGKDSAPVRVVDIGAFAIELRAWTWADNPGDAFVLGCELRENIKARFDKEGIEIPYPYQNVLVSKPDFAE